MDDFIARFDSKLAKVRSTTSSTARSARFVMEESAGTDLVEASPKSNALTVVLELSGASAFAFTPTSQSVDAMRTTRWIWKLEPRDDVEKIGIRVVVVDSKSDPQKAVPFHFDSFEISVDRPWPLRVVQFLSRNWQWIIGSILAPVVALAWRQFRAKSVPPVHTPLRKKLAARLTDRKSHDA